MSGAGEKGDKGVVLWIDGLKRGDGNSHAIFDPVVVKAESAAAESLGFLEEVKRNAHSAGFNRRISSRSSVVAMGAKEVAMAAGGNREIADGGAFDVLWCKSEGSDDFGLQLLQPSNDDVERCWMKDEAASSAHFIRTKFRFHLKERGKEFIALDR